MRVALLIPGYLRCYRETIESLRRNIVSVCHPDVFIYTYNRLGFNANDGALINRRTEPEMPVISRVLSPKKVVIRPHEWIDDAEFSERPDQLKWANERDRGFIKNVINKSPHAKTLQTVLGMFQNIKLADELRRNYEEEAGFKYDVVIRTRMDLIYDKPIDLGELHDAKDAIFLPAFVNCASLGGVNDQFAFGSGELMSKYAEVYDRLKDYFFQDGVTIHPEPLLGHHFRKMNLPVSRTKMTFTIKRGNGHTTDQRKWD